MAIVLKSETVNLTSGKTASFGPFVLPDDEHEFRIYLTRWPDPKSVLSMLTEFSFDGGATWPVTMPDQFSGGIPEKPTKGDGTLYVTGLSPLYMRCDCGNLYVPGDSANIAGEEKPGDKSYIGRGLLSHSKIAIRQGKTLEDVKAKAAATVEEFRLSTVEGDKEFFDRQFHTPASTNAVPRQVRITMTPDADIKTSFTVEV